VTLRRRRFGAHCYGAETIRTMRMGGPWIWIQRWPTPSAPGSNVLPSRTTGQWSRHPCVNQGEPLAVQCTHAINTDIKRVARVTLNYLVAAVGYSFKSEHESAQHRKSDSDWGGILRGLTFHLQQCHGVQMRLHWSAQHEHYWSWVGDSLRDSTYDCKNFFTLLC